MSFKRENFSSISYASPQAHQLRVANDVDKHRVNSLILSTLARTYIAKSEEARVHLRDKNFSLHVLLLLGKFRARAHISLIKQ